MKSLRFLFIALLVLASTLVLGCILPGAQLQTPLSEEHFVFPGYGHSFRTDSMNYTPIIFENPRWAHIPILVHIDTNDPGRHVDFDKYIADIKGALQDWNNGTGITLFAETNDPGSADINISWSNPNPSTTQGGYVYTQIGEAMPAALEIGWFSLLNAANITLIPYYVPCSSRETVVHELGHTLGLAHSNNPKDVMYALSSCPQYLTKNDTDTVWNVYENFSAYELQLDSASITRQGDYLSGDINITNEGIGNFTSINVSFFGDGNALGKLSFKGMNAGYNGTLTFSNFHAPGSYSELRIIINPEDSPKEITIENNAATLQRTG